MSDTERFMELYRRFEDRFRGSPETIRERQTIYLPLIDLVDAEGESRRTALDLGSGRGEWLSMIAAHGWAVVGVDSNHTMAEAARANGIETHETDILAFLRGCDTHAFGLISAFHVVEHLPTDVLIEMLTQIERVLAPGGMVILETPNPENLQVSAWSFHMDPTHRHPLPPALLEFLVECAGFTDTHILRLNSQTLGQDRTADLSPLASLFLTAQDYSVVATKEPSSGALDDGQVERFIGATSHHNPFAGQLIARQVGRYENGMADLVEHGARLRQADDRLEQTGTQIDNLRQATTYLNSKIEELAARVDAHDQQIWSPQRVRRALRHRKNRLLDGLKSWLLLKSGSRPHRTLARGLRAAVRMTDDKPFVKDAAQRVLAWSPSLRGRLLDLYRPELAVPAPVERSLRQKEITALGEPYGVRLAYRRLNQTIQSLDQVTEPRPPVSGDKPRLAFLSPLPPERSGIADYSADLLPLLAEYYDIDLVTNQREIAFEWGTTHCQVRTVAAFEAESAHYDRVLYSFGNSRFHSHMFDLLEKIPGVVVLHDFYLSGILAQLELHEGWGPCWTEALGHSHGYDALEMRFSPARQRQAIEDYPCNFAVLDQAQGIIVHNDYARGLAQRFYPAYRPSNWSVVPFPKKVGPSDQRGAARRTLGLPDDDFVVCSFGFIQASKCSRRLLDAFLASSLADDPNCRLVFVGDNPEDQYGRELKKAIERSPHRDRIRITGFASPQIYNLYLQAADVGVQLRAYSRGETSAAVLDCLAHAMATIVNASGSMREIPETAVLCLPEAFSDWNLIKALTDLFGDADRRGRLGTLARGHVESRHALRRTAALYHEAIEKAATGTAAVDDVVALADAVRHDPALRQAGDAGRRERARALRSMAPLQRPANRLFVDISAMVRDDLKTGIQRVVRAQLIELFKSPPPGFRIEPVWLDLGGEKPRYCYARHYTMGFLGLTGASAVIDEPIEPMESDVFFGADFFPQGIVAAARAGLFAEWRAKGVRLCFNVYDLLPILMPQNFPEGADDTHRDWLAAVVEAGDALVCISQAVADDTARWIADNRPDRSGTIDVEACPLGADIDATSPSKGLPGDAPATLEKIAAARSFLMVGTIEPRKGYLQTLAAFDRLWASGAEICLVIVGAQGWKGLAPEKARTVPQIIGQLRAHPELGRRLIWLERVSDEYLEAIYAASDCLVAASDGEGFGLPLIEAARHGKPIIARGLPVFQEVAGGGAFYFDGDSATDLAAAIEAWSKLYEAGQAPRSTGVTWRKWSASVDHLKRLLVPQDDTDAGTVP